MNDIEDIDAQVRLAMFKYLDGLVSTSLDGALRSADINTFVFDGQPMRLIGPTGIWKPARLQAALTITTTYPRPNQPPLYEDDMGKDGLIRYKYRGLDPQHSDNKSLRAAMVNKCPLAYFIGIDRGVYAAQYPAWLVEEHPARHEFSVAIEDKQFVYEFSDALPSQRVYAERMTRVRLHQSIFRTRVLRAYDDSCAMCHLHHTELLDAAHIIPDNEKNGDPIVTNGMTLCKIHHSAFDANILGIRPDLIIEVRRDILDEHDGPMLQYGLQSLDGNRLTVPRQSLAQPDPARLSVRYERFQVANP